MTTLTIDAPTSATQLKRSSDGIEDCWRVTIHDAAGVLLVVNRLIILEDHGHTIRFHAIPSPGMATGVAAFAKMWNPQGEIKDHCEVRLGPPDRESPPGVICLSDLNIYGASTVVNIGTITFVYLTGAS